MTQTRDSSPTHKKSAQAVEVEQASRPSEANQTSQATPINQKNQAAQASIQGDVLGSAQGSAQDKIQGKTQDKTQGNALDIKALVAVIQQLLGQPWLGLRPDLQLHQGTADNSGLTRWFIEDPVTADRYALGVDEHRLVVALAARSDLEQALRWYQARYGNVPDALALVNILQSFRQENLTVRPPNSDVPPEPPKQPMWRRLYANRIPFMQPDRLLNQTMPLVRWLGQVWVRWLCLFVALVGLGMIIPQSERFFATTGYLLTPQGIVAALVSLVVLKIAHEFCHAFVAKSYGLHVRSMGIVVILFWPILYTDVTDAWRLPSRRQRFDIAIAGIALELCVASWALLAWALLPPGLLQNLAFVIAFTSVVGTLIINANPFMRFDGYYALMDWWGVDNLQTRALAIAQYYWRRAAVDWQGPPPEQHPQQKRMAFYGFGVWLYRLILATVIALAGYALLNAYVGVILFLIIFGGMLILPTINEARQLLKERHNWGSKKRLWLSSIVGLLVIAVLLVPLPQTEQAPSLLLPADYVRIQAPSAGRLTAPLPQAGTRVNSGEVVARLVSPELLHEVTDSDYELRQVRARRKALTGSGEEGGYRNWLAAEEQRIQAQRATAQKASSALSLTSSLTGVVRYRNDNLQVDDWVSEGLVLAELADVSSAKLRVYLDNQQVKISAPDVIEFDCIGLEVPTDITARHNGLQAAPVLQFLNPAWYDQAGGAVATKQADDGELFPRDSWYAIDYTVAMDASKIPLGQPCWATLGSQYRSVLGRLSSAIARQLSTDGVW